MKAKKRPVRGGLTSANRVEYDAWLCMHSRCSNHRHKAFHNYGGRGIEVCERWADFANFLEDMGKRPEGKSLDRIDNDKGYSPENCRWATKKEQCSNQRVNVFMEHDGLRRTVAEWAAVYGLRRDTLARRLERGWDLKTALSAPLAKNKWDSPHRKTYTIGE
jgi:hypothetical protein